MSTNDGGPAFSRSAFEGRLPELFDGGAEGMSLRKWYASQALIGLLSNPGFEWSLAPSYTPEENLANRCFAIADALIAAEEKQS